MASVGLKSRAFRRSAFKNVGIRVGVSRVEETGRLMRVGGKAFVACAHFAKRAGWARSAPRPHYGPAKMHGTCAYGKNPREAIAGALRKAATHVKKRSGAFAGVR